MKAPTESDTQPIISLALDYYAKKVNPPETMAQALAWVVQTNAMLFKLDNMVKFFELEFPDSPIRETVKMLISEEK